MSKKHYIIPIFVPHEGCPHSCVFCNQNSITGTDSKVNVESIRETIDEYLNTMNLNNSIIEVSFSGTFTAIPIEKQISFLMVAKEYKDAKKINFIRLSTRPDYIDIEILENLKKYGVDIIELGVQSLDEEVLIKSGRGHSVKQVETATRLIKEFGFTLGHQVMIGLPGDTPNKDIETAKKVIKLGPSIVRIYPALVIKDTPMEVLYNKGLYDPYSLDKAVELCKVIYGMFLCNNINVIRIGLQPTEDINIGKELISGPFHPAFRELVESSILNEMVYDTLSNIDFKESIVLLNPKDISKLYSNKKSYFNKMIFKLHDKTIRVKNSNDVEQGNILIEYKDCCITLSKYEYLNKKYKEGNL